MLPIERKNSIVEIKKDKYLEHKKMLLQNENVLFGIREKDFMVASAGVEMPIRSYEDNILVSKVATSCKMICRDVGIKDWNNAEVMKYDALRFLNTLKKYYKELSLQEVKMAFELAAIGELDDWLPKDRSGMADKNHYQSFSMEYYTKILNAYKAKKNKVWHKVFKSLPVADVVISEEQRKENKKHFYEDIYKSFDEYKNKEVVPNFVLSIFYKEFVDRGLIDDEEKYSKKAIDRAYLNFINGDTPKREKREVVANYHKNKVSNILKVDVRRFEFNFRIANYYDGLIDKKIDIRDIIN